MFTSGSRKISKTLCPQRADILIRETGRVGTNRKLGGSSLRLAWWKHQGRTEEVESALLVAGPGWVLKDEQEKIRWKNKGGESRQRDTVSEVTKGGVGKAVDKTEMKYHLEDCCSSLGKRWQKMETGQWQLGCHRGDTFKKYLEEK